MARIIMIACVDNNLGIGDKDGNLLYCIPSDLRHFKEETTGNIVVMGRRTFESFDKPLVNRDNYVLTRRRNFSPEGVTVLNNYHDVNELTKKGDVYIIGGGEVYEQYIEYADILIITHVDATNDNTTTFFPCINEYAWTIYKEKELNDEDYDAVVRWYRRT